MDTKLNLENYKVTRNDPRWRIHVQTGSNTWIETAVGEAYKNDRVAELRKAYPSGAIVYKLTVDNGKPYEDELDTIYDWF